MTTPASLPPILFLDYQVLDHMHRIDGGRYSGTSTTELTTLRQAAVAGNIEIWMSGITLVEMTIGLENPNLTPEKLAAARQHDADKCTIADLMHVRWLTYPAGKSNDTYSRTGLTLRTADSDWRKANTLEAQLLKLPGVSAGDARQVVSCICGQAEDTGGCPAIRWFVSEDSPLRTALTDAQAANSINELMRFQVLSVKAFVDGMANRTMMMQGR